jgi:hypothetical protein
MVAPTDAAEGTAVLAPTKAAEWDGPGLRRCEGGMQSSGSSTGAS